VVSVRSQIPSWRSAAAFALGALLLAGCGGAGSGRPPAETGTTTTAPAKPAVEGRTIAFRASDGVRLEGLFVAGKGGRAAGIVLSHEVHGGPDQFALLVRVLKQAGYATFVYSSRGGGGFDETLLARDVAGAVRALRQRPGVDPRRIALIGASIGGSAAAWTIGTKPELKLRAAIGLSAVESPAFIEAGTDGRFRPHDLLLISDRREAANADGLRQDAGGNGVTAWQAPLRGHGVRLLPSEEVRAKILGWLQPRLGRR
jgi:pimeloyl-ACP methyl ester carboxylesterase